MNKGIIGIALLSIVTLIIAFIVYYKKANSDSQLSHFHQVVPANFTDQIIEIPNPNEFIENLMNSNFIWKEVETQFDVFSKFWAQEDSNFDKMKSEAIALYLFEAHSNSYYLFQMPALSDSVELPSAKKIGDFVLFSSGDFSDFEKSSDQDFTLNDMDIFEEKRMNKNSKRTVRIYHRGHKWDFYELNFLPEQVFGSGNVSVSSEGVQIKQSLDLELFNHLPAKFNSVKINQFDSLNFSSKDSLYHGTLDKSCNCESKYSLYNWVASPEVNLVLNVNDPNIIIVKINDLQGFKNGLSDLIPESVDFDGENNQVYSLGSTITFLGKKVNSVLRIDNLAYFSVDKSLLEGLNTRIFSGVTLNSNKELGSFLTTNLNPKSFSISLNKGLDMGIISSKNGVSLFQESYQNEEFTYSSFIYSKEVVIGQGLLNPKWTKTISGELTNNIYKVNNHRTSDINYLVQDKNNVIYFISTTGKILWKREVGNPIISKIKNIDLLGNKKLQLIFTTRNKLFVLDVLGRNVGSFPVEIKDEVSGVVSVMDYDNDLNFRFLVPTKEGIKSVNKNGDIVKGWEQPKPKAQLYGSIYHLSINNLDYIFARDVRGEIYFYNRKGEVRHTVSSTIGAPYYLFNGNTITSSRALFFDSTDNVIGRQFFDDKATSILLSPEKQIKQFFFVDRNKDGQKDFVLVFDDEIVVYGQDLIIQEKISLVSSARNILVWEEGYSYINGFDELVITVGEVNRIIEQVEGYKIDEYKNQYRVFAKFKNSLKLLLLR